MIAASFEINLHYSELLLMLRHLDTADKERFYMKVRLWIGNSALLAKPHAKPPGNLACCSSLVHFDILIQFFFLSRKFDLVFFLNRSFTIIIS